MPVTTFEAIVKDGQIRLPAGVDLPDQTRVYVVIPDLKMRKPIRIYSPRFVNPEDAADFKMEVIRDAGHADM